MTSVHGIQPRQTRHQRLVYKLLADTWPAWTPTAEVRALAGLNPTNASRMLARGVARGWLERRKVKYRHDESGVAVDMVPHGGVRSEWRLTRKGRTEVAQWLLRRADLDDPEWRVP